MNKQEKQRLVKKVLKVPEVWAEDTVNGIVALIEEEVQGISSRKRVKNAL